MATKLELSFSKMAPDGDTAIVCLVGSKGELIPTLDKTLAASIISAMSLAQFKEKLINP